MSTTQEAGDCAPLAQLMREGGGGAACYLGWGIRGGWGGGATCWCHMQPPAMPKLDSPDLSHGLVSGAFSEEAGDAYSTSIPHWKEPHKQDLLSWASA